MTAPPLPHVNDLILTDDELKLIYGLIAHACSPIHAEQGRKRGVIGVQPLLDVACDLMIRGAYQSLGEEGLLALYEKTNKLAMPLV